MTDRPKLERATDANFDDKLYLGANSDVARHPLYADNPRQHFDRHGHSEGRMQLTRAAAGFPATRRSRKYARFAHLLDAACGAGGHFRFVNDEGSFPIVYGAKTHDLSDYEDESANPGLGDFIDAVGLNPDKLFLDVGCGQRSHHFDNCLYLEVYPSVSADLIIEPACRYPIADASLDGIGCFAVMEHMEEPWVAAEEFRRMLKPGGTVFIDYPFLVPVHGYPSHYFNATREGLARLFDKGFEPLKLVTGENQTPDHAIHWQLAGLIEALTDDAVRDELRAMSIADLIAQPPGGALWQRVLAATPEKERSMYAAGNTLIARKL